MTQTTERVRVTETPGLTPQRSRRSLHIVLGSTAVLLGLVAAVALLLMAISSGTSPQNDVRSPDGPQPGIPMSADAAERYFSGLDRVSGRPGVPMSADAAERYLSDVDR